MAEFNRDFLASFLGVVRKYMQMRGNLSQKDLSELTGIGVSTLSRFINQKTREIDPHLVAKIVAKLEMPLHEIIEFVEEDYEPQFKKLVAFYKDGSGGTPPKEEGTEGSLDDEGRPYQRRSGDPMNPNDIDDVLGTLGTAEREAKAHVRIGGRKTTIPFKPDRAHRNNSSTLKEKLEKLTPRQKAYLTDFLNLDVESKDVIVDLGNSLFRYFRQKGMDI